jgi:hypothetical protein
VEDLAEPSIAVVGGAGSSFAAGDVVAGTDTGPRGEVGGGREATHVDADLGDDALGCPSADANDRVETVAGLSERRHHSIDLLVESSDGRLEVLDVVERDRQHRGVVLAEAAAQCLAQLWDLLAQARSGQVGEHLGVTFTVDQRPQHQTA